MKLQFHEKKKFAFHLTKFFIYFAAGDETMEDESMAQSQSVNVQRVTADGIYKFTYSKFYFTEKIMIYLHFFQAPMQRNQLLILENLELVDPMQRMKRLGKHFEFLFVILTFI